MGGMDRLRLMERTVHGLLRRARADGVSQFRVGALISRGRQVLLVRRAPHDSLPGMFELPSGGVEADEGILDALVREVAEETGLRVVSVTAFAGSFDYLSRRSGRTARQFNFVVQVGAGEVRLHPLEHDQLLWAGPDLCVAVNLSAQVRSVLARYWAGAPPAPSATAGTPLPGSRSVPAP
jgi:8-oxo-dGTP diphosphatase